MGVGSKLRKLCSVLSVAPWRSAFLRYRVAASCEHAKVLCELQKCRTVVDIGANRGQFALVARYFFPEARLVSFEPLPGPAALWRAVFKEDKRARLIEAAVGPDAGEAQIHVSARDDSSSLLAITARQNELFPGTAESGTATIRVMRLADTVQDSEIVAPALLKLDVQGFELQALAGCEELLEYFSWVYVECSFVELYTGQALADDVFGWLHDRGFRVDGVYNLSYDEVGRAIQGDFLFVNRVALLAAGAS